MNEHTQYLTWKLGSLLCIHMNDSRTQIDKLTNYKQNYD